MISRETVEHVAKLAKLEFSDEELEAFVPEFQKIVAYVDRLSEVSLEGPDDVQERTAGLKEVRPDQVEVWPEREEGLANAPERRGSLLGVPRVVDKGDARAAP
jgi:aspartyl-tRNA(Asn)/glutamyl-tRNA(Gln) amidotransferase subunit C